MCVCMRVCFEMLKIDFQTVLRTAGQDDNIKSIVTSLIGCVFMCNVRA